MVQHKWHKEIKAWADGIEVQWKAYATEFEWMDVGDGRPMWHRDDVEFRIKPQPKEPQYLSVWLNKEDSDVFLDIGLPSGVLEDSYYKYLGKFQLEVDD
jgi:hypothetical protein